MAECNYQMKNVKKTMAGMAVLLLGTFTLAAGTTAYADDTTAPAPLVRNVPASPISETEVNVQPTNDQGTTKNVPASPVSETEVNVQPAAMATSQSAQSSATAQVRLTSANDSAPVSVSAQSNQQVPAATGTKATVNIPVAPLNQSQTAVKQNTASSITPISQQDRALSQAKQTNRFQRTASHSTHDAAVKHQPVAAMSFGFLGLTGLGLILGRNKKRI